MAIPTILLVDLESIFQQIFNTKGLGQVPSISAVILMGAGFLFFLGLFDDFRNVKPYTKLIGQIMAASLVVFLGFRLHWFHSLTLDTMATLFWIVGITNAFNLIDNMDGLCAGVGIVAALSMAVLYRTSFVEACLMAVVLAGAMGGFLIYNFNPAKIFMGDCGSLVIGFSISVLALYYSENQSASPLSQIGVPVLLLLVPILDTTLVTVIRLLSGRRASTGGRDHTSHRLVLIGFSEKSAVLFLFGVGAIAGLAANFVARSDTLTSPAVIIPIFIAISLMGIYLSQLRVYPEKEFSALRDRSFTPILLELTYKRQLLLVVLDLALLSFAYYLSYRLRFGGPNFSYYFRIFLQSLPAIIGCKLLIFFWLGVYRGFWAYLSTNDVYVVFRASFAASLAGIAVVTFIYRFQDFSKGIFIIDFFLTTGLLLGARGSFRLFLETQKRKTLTGPKVFVYGAGRAGELLLREILNNQQLHVIPIGFIDDDTLKKGKKIQGYSILGSFQEIEQLIEKYQPNGILMSFNQNMEQNATRHRAVEDLCRQHNMFLKRFQITLQPVELD